MLSLILQQVSPALFAGGQEKVSYTSAFEASSCVEFPNVPEAKASHMPSSDSREKWAPFLDGRDSVTA